MKNNRKVFVLDTSVLVYDPNCISSFENNDVLLPITILDELDRVKKFPNDGGKNARLAIRKLDALSNLGEIHNGINIENNIFLKIDTSAYGSIGLDPTYGDSKILACAAKAQSDHPHQQVVLVSKDINLRTRAKAFGISAEDYEKDKIQKSDIYSGFRAVKNTDAGLSLFEAGSISVFDYEETSDMLPNECVLFLNEEGRGIAPGRRVKNQIKLIHDQTPWGLELRNQEQLYATELLLDPNISLVTLNGLAGCGKTLISMACALELVLNAKQYETLMIYRPIQPMGNDIGFLPGDLAEKLSPWFVPIDDAFAFLFSDKTRKKDGWKKQLFQYIDNGTIQKEAMTYIRGRSIPNALMLIDEAQNLSKDEMKTILTRVGNNTKIILTGDIAQIDCQYLDATNNGLTYAIEKFKDYDLAGHISFTKGERSPLATLAAEIL